MDCKCKMKEFFEKDWTMTEKALFTAVAVLSGIVIGFLFSPVKKGVKVLSEIGSHNTHLDLEEDEEE